jgi:hypothetical protein
VSLTLTPTLADPVRLGTAAIVAEIPPVATVLLLTAVVLVALIPSLADTDADVADVGDGDGDDVLKLTLLFLNVNFCLLVLLLLLLFVVAFFDDEFCVPLLPWFAVVGGGRGSNGTGRSGSDRGDGINDDNHVFDDGYDYNDDVV